MQWYSSIALSWFLTIPTIAFCDRSCNSSRSLRYFCCNLNACSVSTSDAFCAMIAEEERKDYYFVYVIYDIPVLELQVGTNDAACTT